MEGKELQALIDSTPDGGVVTIPIGNHWLGDRPLLIRNRKDMVIRGESWWSAIRTRDDWDHPEWPLVDLSGSENMNISMLNIEQRSTIGPKGSRAACGILQARTYKGSGQGAIFQQVRVNGVFKLAAVINVASEVCRYDNCLFRSGSAADHYRDTLSGPCFLWRSQQPHRLLSPGGEIEGGSHSALTFTNCSCEQFSFAPGARCLQIDDGHILNWTGGCWSLKNSNKKSVCLDLSNCWSLSFTGVSFEAYSAEFLELRDKVSVDSIGFRGCFADCLDFYGTKQDERKLRLIKRFQATNDFRNRTTGITTLL